MADYKGIKCPVCDIPFKDGDDIVVCPICGAPSHRHCYEEIGHCIFEDEHENGKAWEAPKPPKPEPTAEIKDKECPVCGTLNAHSASFCNRCNAPLIDETKTYNNSGYTPPHGQVPPNYSSFGGGMSGFTFDPMGGVNPAESLDDNVTFGDVSKLVKNNTNYYMPVFRNKAKLGRGKFNFTAFLFSGPWMLVRKQYRLGIFMTVIMFTLLILQNICTYWLSYPTITEALAVAGINTTTTTLTMTEISRAIAEVVMKDSLMMLKVFSPYIVWAVMLVFMIVCGVNGNKWYMNHCIKTIKAIKSTEGPNETGAMIEAKGGVNIGIGLCMFVSYAIISMMPTMFSNFL